MNTRLKLAYGVLGLLLAVIGLSGLPEDIRGWADWLDWIDKDVIRWTLLSLGLAIIVGVNFGPPIWRRIQSRPELVVTITHEDFTKYDDKALIIELNIEVKNRAGRRKQIGETVFVCATGRYSNDLKDQAVLSEVSRRQRSHQTLPTVADPHSKVSGWLVYQCSIPSRPGHPDYTFIVIDELNVHHVARRKVR